MSMLEIRKIIYKKAKEIYSQSYIDEALPNATYPYAVISFVGSEVIEEQESYLMDIDIWNNSLNSNIDQVSDLFWSAFRKWSYLDEKNQISVYRISRITVPDPDPVIRRRKLTFTVKYMNRELI